MVADRGLDTGDLVRRAEKTRDDLAALVAQLDELVAELTRDESRRRDRKAGGEHGS